MTPQDEIEPFSIAQVESSIRKATPQLLAQISGDSNTGKLRDVMIKLHGETDGKLRLSDIFVDLAQGKGLLISETERQQLAEILTPQTTRRGFGKTLAKLALGGGTLAYLNNHADKEDKRLNKEYARASSAGESTRHIREQEHNNSTGQMVVNALGIPALLAWIAKDYMPPAKPDESSHEQATQKDYMEPDGYIEPAAKSGELSREQATKNAIAKLENAMNIVVETVVKSPEHKLSRS